MSHHILIVVDEPALQELLQELLEEQGYIVETTRDGVEALARIEQNRPALVILDLLLPRMGGLKLATLLSAQGQPLPVLILSASVQARDLVQTVGAEFMAKPFDIDDLLTAVARLLAGPSTP